MQVFTAQPHVTSGIAGPLFIEGNETAPRALVQGVALPTEVNPALNTYTPHADAQYKLDTLNVFDDGAVANQTGHLGSISSAEFNTLARCT